MQITRQQEITLWKLLAESFDLKYRGDGLYRGNCPFCGLPKIFGINVEKNFAECLDCGKGGNSLEKTLNALFSNSKYKNKLKKSKLN